MYLLQAGQGGGFSGQIIMIGLMFLVVWFFFVRPQAKRAKQQKSFTDSLQKGDKVVTMAGIHGTVNRLNDDGTINLEISPGSYIKIEKSAISYDYTSALNKAGTATTPASKP